MIPCNPDAFWHTGKLERPSGAGCSLPANPSARDVPMTRTATRKAQTGFSLLELLVAMTILAVLATVGFREVRKHTAQARYVKAQDVLKLVNDGLTTYYLKHGAYPELGSWEAMVDANGPLVKQSMIPANTPAKDPWGQPYEGSSTKANFVLKSQGDPTNPEDYGPLSMEPGRFSGAGPAAPAGAPASPAAPAAPAGAPAK